MEPLQVELLTKVSLLLGVMFGAAGASAWVFRKVVGCGFLIASFAVTVLLIVAIVAFGSSNDPWVIIPLTALFGASVGSTLGAFTLAVTSGSKRGAEAVALTIGIIGVATVVTAIIGLLSGFSFQGMGGVLMAILLGVVGISFLGIFVYFGRIMEMALGLGVSLFFMIYMVYDFNKIVYLYTDATWGTAAKIAMSLFLDMVNIFVRLLPVIVEILDALN